MPENIKDMTPNQDTVSMLEKLLDEAKRGEIRTIVYFLGSESDEFYHGWSLDPRNSRRRLIGEVTLLLHDLVNNTHLEEGDAVLAKAFQD